MFDKMFVSPQVKPIVIMSNKHVIISNKHGIYELLNHLRLSTRGNLKKISKLHRIIAWCSILLSKLKFCQYQQNILENQTLNFSGRVLFDRKTTLCLKYFGQDCLRKQFFASNWPPGPFKFDLTILLSLRTLIKFFNLESEELICKTLRKFLLLDNYFSDLFTEVEICD